ncbi:MAG TPA: hypothetical protein VGS16_06790 [Candidatus Dormibacteraeota bacterium]|nr:hypothetical protein [Candidatus Dormibacteraeota bacterium]
MRQEIDRAARLEMGIRGSAAARLVTGSPNGSLGGIVQAQVA